MKRVTLIAIFLWTAGRCMAQDYYVPPSSYHPGHIHTWHDSSAHVSFFFSFDLGVSVPFRDYGSRDTNRNFMIIGPDSTHGKGFANAGFHTSISGGVFITPYMGFCAKIAFNQNTFDQSALNMAVNGQYTYTINADYTIWQFMGGVFGNFQLGKKSSLWVQGMLGLISADFPSFSIYNLPQNLFLPQLSWNFTLPNANVLAYSLTVMYEKPVSLNTSFIATASYTGAELSYPTLTYDFSGPYRGLPPPYTQHTPVTMSFGSLDIAVGFLFHF